MFYRQQKRLRFPSSCKLDNTPPHNEASLQNKSSRRRRYSSFMFSAYVEGLGHRLAILQTLRLTTIHTLSLVFSHQSLPHPSEWVFTMAASTATKPSAASSFASPITPPAPKSNQRPTGFVPNYVPLLLFSTSPLFVFLRCCYLCYF